MGWARLDLTCACTLAIAVVSAGSAPGEEVSGSQGIDQAIRAELTVSEYTLVQLDLPMESGVPFFAPVELNGESFTLDLRPHSVRSPEFEVLVPDAGASDGFRSVDPPPSMTYRGGVLEAPGAITSGAIFNGGLRAVIRFDELMTWVVMPVSELTPGADPRTHVVYNAADGEPAGWICGNDILGGDRFKALAPHDHLHDHNGGPEVDGEDIYIAEIAFDADYEFYRLNGSSVDATVADIEAVLNDINVIYERDVLLRHRITTIIVRESEPDPYSGNNAGGILDQMVNHWLGQQQKVERDVAHLMTGISIDGGTIGLAYLGVICDGRWGYGLSESRFTSRFDWRVGVTAHELGHNWSADHCSPDCSSGPDCRIMCPCIAGCSGNVTAFGEMSIAQITSYSEEVQDCLERYNPFALGVGALHGGEVANIDVHGGLPDAEVRVYYTVRGPGTCPIKDLGVVIEMANCRLALSGTTDSAGVKTWTVRIPNVNEPRPVGLQAAQQGQVSNLVRRRIQP